MSDSEADSQVSTSSEEDSDVESEDSEDEEGDEDEEQDQLTGEALAQAVASVFGAGEAMRVVFAAISDKIHSSNIDLGASTRDLSRSAALTGYVSVPSQLLFEFSPPCTAALETGPGECLS